LKLLSNLLIKSNNKPKLSLIQLHHHKKTPRLSAVIIRSPIKPLSRKKRPRSKMNQARKIVKIVALTLLSIFVLRIQAIISIIAFIRIMSAIAKNNSIFW